jgi:hypothetical protein
MSIPVGLLSEFSDWFRHAEKRERYAALLLMSLAAIMVWFFVVNPVMAWVEANRLWILAGMAVVAVTGAYLYRRSLKLEKKRAEGRNAFAEAQAAKGLVPFIDGFNQEHWGTAEEVARWQEELHKTELRDYRDSDAFRVERAIEEFQASARYDDPFPYQTELQGWLKSRFPSSVSEGEAHLTKPAIVIDDIAIEVTGPTDDLALENLATKCLKYSHDWKNVIIVLFEPQFAESNYALVLEGIKQHFPNVRVIRKDVPLRDRFRRYTHHLDEQDR